MRNRLLLKVAAVCGAIVSVTMVANAFVATYSADESRAKLQAIGQALKLYRADYCTKEPDEWVTPADAGLPPFMTILAQPGHSWSLPNGVSTFHLTAPLIPGMGAMDFVHTYPFEAIKSKANELYPGYASLLHSRGEKIPVLLDPHYDLTIPRNSSPAHALVLRLDGTVDEVVHDPTNLTDVLTR